MEIRFQRIRYAIKLFVYPDLHSSVPNAMNVYMYLSCNNDYLAPRLGRVAAVTT